MQLGSLLVVGANNHFYASVATLPKVGEVGKAPILISLVLIARTPQWRSFQVASQGTFDSGLIEKVGLVQEYRSGEEKLERYGFVHWTRIREQDASGAFRPILPSAAISYSIRDASWSNTKHLRCIDGKWFRRGNEMRFWNLSERVPDTLIKRMVNYLGCGFCVVECFPCRRFDREGNDKMHHFGHNDRLESCGSTPNCG